MTAIASIPASNECELLLDLLSRHNQSRKIHDILQAAQDVRRLLHLYSFHSPRQAEMLLEKLSSQYRSENLTLYGSAPLPPRQSSSAYLRLEQLLALLARAALLRLCRTGDLPFTKTQLTQSDGIVLQLLQKEMQQKTDS